MAPGGDRRGDGCAAFDRIDVERDGTAFIATAWNTRATHDGPCPSVGRLDVNTVDLGNDLEPGTEYALRVNALEGSFVAQ